MKVVILSFLIILVSNTCNAADLSKGLRNLKELTLKGEPPSYWFKINRTADLISFTRVHIEKHKVVNYILNTRNFKYTAVPGEVDPVFIGDDLIVTANSQETGTGYSFFSLSKLFNGEKAASKVFAEDHLVGTYQSIGIISENSQQLVFRMTVAAYNTGTKKGEFNAIQDYIFDKNSLEMKRIGGIRPICTNYKVKLPMLSKDGKYLYGIAKKNKWKSVVLKITDTKKCKLIAKLTEPAAKINGSYDGRFLTYHSLGNVRDSSGFINIPNSLQTANVYLHDLETNRTHLITNNSTSNSLYPDFTEDNKLVFIDYSHGNFEEVKFYYLDFNGILN